MTEPISSGGVLAWIIGAFLMPVFGFATWVGKLHGKVGRNSDDIDKILSGLKSRRRDDTRMHERAATMEADIKHLVKWADSQVRDK